MRYLNKKRYFKLKKLCVNYKKYIELYKYYSDTTLTNYNYRNDIVGDYSLYLIKYADVINNIIGSAKRVSKDKWYIILDAACNWTSYTELKTKYIDIWNSDEFKRMYGHFFILLDQTHVREKFLHFDEKNTKEE